VRCKDCGCLENVHAATGLCFDCAIGKVNDDPNYCGLGKITTDEHDPFWQSACVDHDLNMSHKRKSALGTALEFTVDVLNTAVINTAKAAYSVALAPVYILIGGGGGLIRDIYKRWKK